MNAVVMRSLLSGLALCALAVHGGAVSATELGIEGARFTVNDSPTFLYGISYYGGLGASDESVRRDLDDMRRLRINWMRVWATWDAKGDDLAAIDAALGQPRRPYFDRLERLVAECDRRGMIVDVTLSRGIGVGDARLENQEQHRRVVTALAEKLRPYRNWYLDLSNERNIGDKRFTSFADLKQLRDDVKAIDAARLVTASQGGDIEREELAEYLFAAEVDFITPHRPRGENSPPATELNARQLLAWLKELDRVVPVHYQEPFRRGYADWQPGADDFVTDALGARAGGAAGWCLHNGSDRAVEVGARGRSFDLREQRLFEQLDEVELAALEQLRPHMVGE